MSETVFIISAEKQIDGQGNFDETHHHLASLQSSGIEIPEFVISPLRDGWDTPLAENHFRSGCAPIMALEAGYQAIQEGTHQAILISGEDLLKTGYSREERHDFMNIYGDDAPSIPEGYNILAKIFCKKQGISEQDFIQYSENLFENYQSTYLVNGGSKLPSEAWFQKVTPLFRGVDCANPVVDFSGKILLGNSSILKKCGISEESSVQVAGVKSVELANDGEESLDEIANYQHLKTAFDESRNAANVDLSEALAQDNAVLEAYTCYPIVPIAFLFSSGLIKNVDEIPAFLEKYSITTTGGMNLGKAPWNNPALNGLIQVYEKMRSSKKQWGVVHGNGGLGYRQGIAFLQQA
ncbi:MAG: hypothetical protein ACI86H_000569 [bacterium]|jgi:hypothetical protein